METNQSPEIVASPLSKHILSAVESVRLSAQLGREKVVGKIRDAKIGVLGLSLGSAFLLAACGGDATPAGTTVSAFPPIPPAPEMQASSDGSTPPSLVEIKPYSDKRTDGSDAFTQPLRPEERISFEQDVDTLVSIVRDFFNEGWLKSNGYNLDTISNYLKSLNDDQLVRGFPKGFTKGSNNQDFSTRNYTRDGYRPLEYTKDLPFHISFSRDGKTGEITKRDLEFIVDKNGKLLSFPDNLPSNTGTQDDFTKLLGKLSGAIKIPDGSKPGSTLADLDWESIRGTDLESRRRAVIRDDEGDTEITLTQMPKVPNLVSVSFFKHLPAIKR